MKKTLIYSLALLLGVFVIDASAQGSLSNQVLRLLSRANTWTGINIYSPTVGLVIGTDGTDPDAGTTNTLYNKGGNLYFNGNVLQSSATGGTVTSVGLTAPTAVFDVANSPVTSSGTLAITFDTQTANTVFSGPTTGAAAAPTFRALVAADIPDISATYLTPAGAAALTNKTGNISQWTNNSGYITNSVASLTSLTAVGTIATGTWNGTVVSGLYGGTGVANSGKTITLGGNLTTSGAYNLTATLTGNTSVTFPTSGTLLSTGVTALSSLATVGTITSGTWNGTTVGVVYGGTGLTSATQGDIIYASGANTLAKLAKSASATRYLSNTGTSNNPAWAQVDLTTGVTGILPSANGGFGVDTSGVTNGQLLIGKTSDNSLNLATLTGTSDQITVTNGAGTITLSTPQSINTTSTPRFARLGLGTGAGATAVLTTTGTFDTGYYNAGNSSTAITIDLLNGMTQKVTLTDNPIITINNPISGTTYTLVLIQDGSGNRTVTWPGTLVWQGGAAPTLTTTGGKADIITLTWNGTGYYGSASLNY